jgi:RHS repeat-associated protein
VNWFRYVGRSGYYFDTDPTEFYVRARRYDPLVARWMSRVVMTRGGFRAIDVLNMYIYTSNNPLQSGDPAGLDDPPARPKPDPPNWFPPVWGYGWYCGGFRTGPPKALANASG